MTIISHEYTHHAPLRRRAASATRCPTLVIPLTRTLIVATAIASRDYQDVHHDPGLAQERGSPDIFMNILSTNGFVGRFITDWAGPDAILKSVKIRLGAPNHPGDTMTMTGHGQRQGRRRRSRCTVRGANDLGDHVTGTVALELPAVSERNQLRDGRPSPASAPPSSRRTRGAPSCGSRSRRARRRSPTPASSRPRSTGW